MSDNSVPAPTTFHPSDANRYRLSFTAGGLLPAEMAELAGAFGRLGDWDQVYDGVRAGALLGYGVAKTAARIGSELISRLQDLSEAQLTFLASCLPEERRTMSWIAVCRHYSFLGEFAVEVVRDRFLAGVPTVTKIDYSSFFDRKAAMHSELSSVSDSTREKLRQVSFRMMVDAGILDRTGRILPISVPAPLFSLLDRGDILHLPLYVREA